MTKLLLKPTTIEDCIYFAKWEKAPHVTEFFSIEDGWTYEDVKMDFLKNKEDENKKQFTIIKAVDEKPIGRIYISRIDHHTKSLDITRIYIGDMEHRGKGYGRKALMLALDWSFNEKNFHRVTLDYFSGNEIAKNLYISSGFKHEGIARESAFKNGQFYDLELMSILEHEYKLHNYL